MKAIAAVASLAVFCSGCASSGLGKLEKPSFSKEDAAKLISAPNATGVVLSANDKVIFSKLHDIVEVNCLYYKNKHNKFATIGNITITDGDVALATIAPLISLTATGKTGPMAMTASLATLFASQIKSMAGFPALVPDYSGTIYGFDLVYNTFITSPGIASMMSDDTPGRPQRTLALKEYIIALQQVCISDMKFPQTNSVYAPAQTAPTEISIAPSK